MGCVVVKQIGLDAKTENTAVWNILIYTPDPIVYDMQVGVVVHSACLRKQDRRPA